MPGASSSLVERISRLFWIGVPVAMRRTSAGISGVLADGAYLAAWPWVAVLAPPLSLIAGLGLGWNHPGEIFTNSILMMLGMFLVANFSSALGFWMWTGFLLGDFSHPHFIPRGDSFLFHLFHFWIPLVLVNLLLGSLLVYLPLSAKALRLQTRKELKLTWLNAPWKDVLLQTIIQMALVWVWTQSVPALVRPVWTWQQLIIPVDHIRPLQHDGWILVLAAGFAGAVRVFLEYRATAQAGVSSQTRELQLAFAHIETQGVFHIPVPASFVLKAGFSTFMFSGLITRWWEALELMLLFLLFFWLRAVLSTHLVSWRRATSRVPLLVRLAVASALGALLGWPLLTRMWGQGDSFQSIIVLAGISLLTITFLAPGYGIPAKVPLEKRS
jgi:hypothetical protein